MTLDILAIGRVMCSSQKLLNGIYCPCTPVSTSANALLTGYKQRFDNQSRSCNQGCSQYNSTCLYIEYRPTYPLYCIFFLWITLVQERTLEYGCTMIHKPLLITFTRRSFSSLYISVFIPPQGKNRQKADFCPSGFINFALPKNLCTYHDILL